MFSAAADAPRPACVINYEGNRAVLSMSKRSLYSCAALAFQCAFLILVVSRCGWIADSDRIVVAKADGKAIRRGDLMRIIRDMPDEERPLIQNKGDLLRALNRHIDDTIKQKLGDELSTAGKISVPREVARESYFQKHPENRKVFEIQDPSALDMTDSQVRALRDGVEFEIDDEEKKLLREKALIYAVQEAVNNGALTVTPEELQREYDLRAAELMTFETLDFVAIRFPADDPKSTAAAARVMDQVRHGTAFEEIANAFETQNPGMVIRPVFENNPASERFRIFWEQASGHTAGDAFMAKLPAYEQVKPGANGQPAQSVQMPAAQLVVKVVENRPPRKKTFEESRNDLATPLLISKMMRDLRTQHGVEVYDGKVPNPAGLGNQYKDLVMQSQGLTNSK
mgnify:FL=1